MIICRGESKGGATQALILGLSRENVIRLMAGQPIRISRKTHGGVPLGWEIIILGGALWSQVNSICSPARFSGRSSVGM